MILGACFASAGAQLSLYTTVDLALRNSPAVRAETAAVERAASGVSEATDAYKPNIILGSGLGYSYGFPVGQPSIYNLTAQSLVLSFSQHDYIRSSRSALKAAQLQLRDTRQQVILDTALNYIQLAKDEKESAALADEAGDVRQLVRIEEDRVSAGLDSRTELTEARLTGAQARLKQLQLENEIALLKAKLGHLTGLAPLDIGVESKTIPVADPAQLSRDLAGTAGGSANQGVQAAYASAKSKLYAAFGDNRQNLRPTISFVAQYNRYAKFNNYNEYYLRFQHNNFGVGVQITLPVFDAALKAKADGSRAAAARAQAEADLLRDQTSERMLEMQKSLAVLEAQQQVAGLESELARERLAAITTRLQSSGSNPAAAPLTPRDEQLAKIAERQRAMDAMDADFALTRAQLTLMRTMGTIEDWAKAAPQAAP